MYQICTALAVAMLMLFASAGMALAQSFTVPMTVGGETYTMTVSLEGDGISVSSESPDVEIGTIKELEPEAETTDVDIDTLKAEAVTIPYDELFRYNERHIGEAVRYIGEVLEFQQRPCDACENPTAILRVAVTEGRYSWEDPIWVDYAGTERFLEDDIVTVWGTVEGLESYTAVLGNTVTVPKVTAADIVLGRVENSAVKTVSSIDAEPSVSTDSAGPTANNNANLRGGPGTEYPIVGSTSTGQSLDIAARNGDGSWLQLDTGEWIAAFLVDNAPAATDILEAEEIPEPPAPAEPTPAPTESPTTTATEESDSESTTETTSSIVNIGEEIQGNGWRFHVKEIHKRKAVYWHNDSYVAMGHFLVVIIDAVNEQSGTDYFANNIEPYLTDTAGNVYRHSSKASSYAQWQYGGISSIYSDVNPGSLARIAMAFDLSEDVGEVLLSTDVPAWVNLGNFSEMAVED